MAEAALKAREARKDDQAAVESIDVAAVNKRETRSLYKKREKIYPRLARGNFRRLKWVIMALTLSLAVFKTALVVVLRRAVAYVQPVSAVLMLAAGGFIVYYWLTFGQLLDEF